MLGPAGLHQVADDVPGLDGGVIDDELILLFCFGFGADFYRPLHEREGVLNLFQICVAFFLKLCNFTLLKVLPAV